MLGRFNQRANGSFGEQKFNVDGESMDPIYNRAMGTTGAMQQIGMNALRPHDEPFVKKRKLGQGGFGTVWLCERQKAKVASRREMPRKFALKELSSPKVFRPGVSGDIREYLPLNEPSIQRFLKHRTIVETYWADVRCLDPKTNEPLEITAYELTVDADADDGGKPPGMTADTSWTPLDKLREMEKGAMEASRDVNAATNVPLAIKLQMRIAMEHCDLGSLKDFLVRPGAQTKTLADQITRKQGGRIDMLRCILLTALDIAEALKFMHRVNTLHGDLKPHNILLVYDRHDEKLFRAKVSDFGLSAHMTAGQTCVEISQGTEAYLPLEVFEDLAVTEASDIYALGLLMWEAYYGIFWFSVWDAEKKRRRAKSPFDMDSYRPSCSDTCPSEFAMIVHDCIKCNPALRPSAADVCSRLNHCLSTLCPAPSTADNQPQLQSGGPFWGTLSGVNGTNGAESVNKSWHAGQGHAGLGKTSQNGSQMKKRSSWASLMCFGSSPVRE